MKRIKFRIARHRIWPRHLVLQDDEMYGLFR